MTEQREVKEIQVVRLTREVATLREACSVAKAAEEGGARMIQVVGKERLMPSGEYFDEPSYKVSWAYPQGKDIPQNYFVPSVRSEAVAVDVSPKPPKSLSTTGRREN